MLAAYPYLLFVYQFAGIAIGGGSRDPLALTENVIVSLMTGDVRACIMMKRECDCVINDWWII